MGAHSPIVLIPSEGEHAQGPHGAQWPRNWGVRFSANA